MKLKTILTPGSATPMVIDTDMAGDDWMAILYLLNRPDVDVQAITVTGTGEAHCDPGVRNALDLAYLAGRVDIPVSCGREAPLAGDRAFPAHWRNRVDRLFGLQLPESPARSAGVTAVELLSKAIRRSPGQVHILALGPLTNLGELLAAEPRLAGQIGMITIMGGAVHVPGNVGPSCDIDNDVAEWNIFVDPRAANIVFSSGAPVTLVPLDATNDVPITLSFLNRLDAVRSTPAADFIYRYLLTREEDLRGGYYYFWDPLAAVIITDPQIASFDFKQLVVDETEGPVAGHTRVDNAGSPIRVAVGANRIEFEELFLQVLNHHASLPG